MVAAHSSMPSNIMHGDRTNIEMFGYVTSAFTPWGMVVNVHTDHLFIGETPMKLRQTAVV